MGALVDIEPRRLAVEPGAAATVQVRIRNNGAVVDQFDLTVLGDAQAWVTIEPAVVSLFPGAEGTATLTFAPPRSSRTRAGEMRFGLRVQSKEDPSGSTVEEGTLDVAPFREVTAELVPRTSRGSGGATHDVALDNRGNVPMSATIAAVDADRLLGFEVRPPALNADPGAAVFAKVRVIPKRRFWRGPATNRPFQLQVEAPDTPPVFLDGALLQTAVLPPWTFRALALAAILLVAGILLWNSLVKPAIEATAREQAEEVLAEVGITPLPSGAGAPTGGGGSSSESPGSGSSESPTTSGDPSASPTVTSAPTPPGGATPADGRLLPGAAPLPPPADKSLFLTDLIFSNPRSDVAGEIRLQRDGQPLIVLRLENFRDLDFHFVTPIVVGPDQDIALVCDPACPGSAVYYSGYAR